MSEQLYKKVITGKRVRYEPAVPQTMGLVEVDSEEVFSILTVVIVSFMGSVLDQLPSHSKQAREVRKLADCLAEFSKLHHAPIVGNPLYVDNGLKVWAAMVKEMQRQLQ